MWETMKYSPSFAICGLFFLIAIMAFYLNNQYIQNKRSKIFGQILLLSGIGVVLDILCGVVLFYAPRHRILWLMYVGGGIFYFLRILLFFFYIYYLMIFLEIKPPKKKIWTELLFLPLILVALYQLANPVFVLSGHSAWSVFYFVDYELYVGYGNTITFLCTFIYLITGIFLARKSQGKLPHMQKLVPLAYFLIAMGGAALQVLFPHYFFSGMEYSLIAFIIFLSMQNPAEYMDRSTGLFNAEAFTLMAREERFNTESYRIVGIHMTNTEQAGRIWGLHAPEILIKQVAKSLTRLAPQEFKFRIGEDDFVLLMQADQVMEFCAAFTRHIHEGWDMNQVKITGEADLFVLPNTPELYTTDGHLKVLRQVFKTVPPRENKICTVLNGECVKKACRIFSVEEAIEFAIENKLFQVYLEPIYCVERQRFCGAEALIRLKDDNLGFIPPDEFVTLAETNGNIIEIGNIILEKICQFLAQEDVKALGMHRVNVNLSAIQCIQKTLAKDIIAITRKYGIDISILNFEITETALGSDLEVIRSNMNALIQEGAIFSMDDFGTGYSNMNYLTELPFSVIKLDKKLVYAAEKGGRSFVLMEKLITMFHDFGMQVVCEGAETKTQSRMLADMHTDFIQGYYYARPMDTRSFVNFLQENNH